MKYCCCCCWTSLLRIVECCKGQTLAHQCCCCYLPQTGASQDSVQRALKLPHLETRRCLCGDCAVVAGKDGRVGHVAAAAAAALSFLSLLQHSLSATPTAAATRYRLAFHDFPFCLRQCVDVLCDENSFNAGLAGTKKNSKVKAICRRSRNSSAQVKQQRERRLDLFIFSYCIFCSYRDLD